MPRSTRLALIAALCAGLAGCHAPKGKGSGDGGAADGSMDGGGDGGADAGDGKCHSQQDCSVIEYCELSTGACLPAKTCQTSMIDPTGDAACEYSTPTDSDYCAFNSCWCDVNRGGGTCLPRTPLCAPCREDVECGNDPNSFFDYTAGCAAFSAAAGSQKVCLPLSANNCPPGYIEGSGSSVAYCLPSGGMCGAAGMCTSDSDCEPASAHPICDTTQHFCKAACTFDYQTATSPDCPPDQICHVDPRLLSPSTNPNFGKGRCGDACDGSGMYACPSGTMCVADGSDHAAMKQDRCRPPPPDCIRDQDCPGNPGGHSLGACVLATLSCTSGCVTNTNCDSGYHCASGSCSQQTCIEEGGANIACGAAQFCCGETNSPDCPGGVPQGQCYDAPNPPWCGDCSTDGQALTAPAGGNRPLGSVCELGKQWISCDSTQSGQCPRSEACDDGPMFCKMDADCGGNGSCAMLMTPYGNTMGCSCASGKTCPANSVCGPDSNNMNTICYAKWCDMRSCYPMMGP